jgi:3-oxoacyl-ACP reductase-like protein
MRQIRPGITPSSKPPAPRNTKPNLPHRANNILKSAFLSFFFHFPILIFLSHPTSSQHPHPPKPPKMSMSISECQTPRPGFPKPVPDTPTNVLEQFSMKGKVIVVTGAAEGIGGAVVDAMAEAGGDVVLWYNSNKMAEERAERLGRECGVRTMAMSVDGR